MQGARVLIVQYAGDFREAIRRLADQGPENYYGQRYSIESVVSIAGHADEVATLCGITDEKHNELVAPKVRSIGAGFNNGFDEDTFLRLAQEYKPTHLILRTPNKPILRWAVKNKLRTILTLADSFQGNGLRHWLAQRSLVGLLNDPGVEWVGNHGWNASRDLVRIGVKKAKVVPWDWPHPQTPSDLEAKTAPQPGEPIRLAYVGLITPAKGIGDVIEAIAKLKSAGRVVSLTVAGKGDIPRYEAEAEKLGVRSQIEIRGIVPNNEIVPLMRSVGAVVIPSRHEYPEGFPMTIYEALKSRSPVICSDHPMFRGILSDGRNAMVFKAADPAGLANQIDQLFSSAPLYETLSKAATQTWKELEIPIIWGEFAARWTIDPPAAFQQWLGTRGVGGALTDRL